MNRDRACNNCGKQFTPVHRLIAEHGDGGRRDYCTPLCQKLAANRRRRTKRNYRDTGQVVTCYCVTCDTEFAQDDTDQHDEDDGHCWYIVDWTDRACVECGKPARGDDPFCDDPPDACYIAFGNRLIPHDPKHPLTAEDITWSPFFDKVIEPLMLKMRNDP
jgi:hypothetical protein